MAGNTRTSHQEYTKGNIRRVIKNSVTVKVRDFVLDGAVGILAVANVTDKVLGFLTSINTSDGISLESPSCNPANYNGTWTASTKTYAAASDNQTVKMVQGEVRKIREGDRFIATLSAAKGTTTGSDKAGYYLSINTSDASQLLESSAATTATNCQFRITNPLLNGSATEVEVECILRQENA